MIGRVAAATIALSVMASFGVGVTSASAQAAPTASAPTVTVSEPSAEVHKAPSVGSPVVGKALRGAELTVMRDLGSWVRVSWPAGENGIGYVHVNALRQGTAANESRLASTTSAATRPAAAAPTSTSAPAATSSASPSQVPVPLRPAPVVPPAQSYSTPIRHIVGLGGQIGDAMGVGVRGWEQRRGRSHVGFQVNASRTSVTSPVSSDRLTSVFMEPSVLVSLPDHVSDYVWLRPYVGTGLGLRRHTIGRGLGAATSPTESSWGTHAFGGGEITFAGLPRLTVSADAGHRWSRTRVAGFDERGVHVAVSGHWYLK